jgi:hypothetical protein
MREFLFSSLNQLARGGCAVRIVAGCRRGMLHETAVPVRYVVAEERVTEGRDRLLNDAA